MSTLTLPRTKDFSAWIDLSSGQMPKLVVTGLVETNSTIEQPVLWLNDTQFPMSRTLSLNLAIRNLGGVGTKGPGLRAAQFAFPASAGEFEEIRIAWGGAEIIQLQVTEKQ